jgi:hypothetical protein
VKQNQSYLWEGRVLVWFSCGAASAVAAKLALEKYRGSRQVEVIYCDTLKYEHPDNPRFLADVERWLDVKIKLIKSTKYEDIFDVFTKEKYIAGINGARCTRCLKRDVRIDYQSAEDVHVFGYTVDEQERIDQFESQNSAMICEWPLRDQNIAKTDCYRIVKEAGIALPAMYLMGYKNNNCIGCVKGGAGYWNKIRVDFPESFHRMATFTRQAGVKLISVKGERIFLDELPLGAGRHDEPDIECGPQCVLPKFTEEDDAQSS